VAQLYPRALGCLYVVSYDSQGYGGDILTLPQPGGLGPRICILQEQDGPSLNCQSQSRSYFMADGQSVSMSWCRAPLWAHDQVLFFPFFCQKIALLFVLGCPLWWEDGSVICSEVLSRRGLITIHYCLIWDYWVPFPVGVFLPAFTPGSLSWSGVMLRLTVSQYGLASSPLMGLATRY
jgi:hypothetical protein